MKMRSTTVVILLLTAVAGFGVRGAQALPSQLKVGVCSSEQDGVHAEPFVILDEKTRAVSGHDVDLWEGVVNRSKEWVGLQFAGAVADQDEEKEAEFRELLEFFGTDNVKAQPMPFNAMLNGLEQGSLHVGLCGLHMSGALQRRFNFLPPYLSTALTPLVKRESGNIPVSHLLEVILGNTDQFAIFALQLLMIFAIIFAHAIWWLERKVNTRISERYADGLWDSLWFAIVTATTVGYGDKSPETYAGKLLTIGWMLVGMFFVSLFVASITTALLTTRERMALESTTRRVDTLDELASLKIGTSFFAATDAVRGQLQGASVTQYASQKEALDALVGGDVDALVEDLWRANYLVHGQGNEFEFHGQLATTDLTFSHADIGVGVTTNIAPRLMQALSVGMLDHTRGPGMAEFQVNRALWFGAPGAERLEMNSDVESAIAESLEAFNTPVSIVLSMCLVIWGVLVVWSNWRRIVAADRRQKMKEHMGLGKGTFSNEKLKKHSAALYRSMLSPGQTQPTVVEVVSELTRLGQKVTLKDVMGAVEEQDVIDTEAKERSHSPVRSALRGHRDHEEDGDSFDIAPLTRSTAGMNRTSSMDSNGSAGKGARLKNKLKVVPGMLFRKETLKSLETLTHLSAAPSMSNRRRGEDAEVHHDAGTLRVSEAAFLIVVRPLVQPKEMDQDQHDSHKPCMEYHIVDLRDDLHKKLNTLQKRVVLELLESMPSQKLRSKKPASDSRTDILNAWRLSVLETKAASEVRGRAADKDEADKDETDKDEVEEDKREESPNLGPTKGPAVFGPATVQPPSIVSNSQPPLWGIPDSRHGPMPVNNETEGRPSNAPEGMACSPSKAAASLPQMMIGALSIIKNKAGADSSFSTRGQGPARKLTSPRSADMAGAQASDTVGGSATEFVAALEGIRAIQRASSTSPGKARNGDHSHDAADRV